MKIDEFLTSDLASTVARSAQVEADGYDGLWTGEASHEPFLQLVQAAGATSRVDLGTSVAIAFARTPMVVANVAWDLQVYSQGRFILGLGSQIKAHVERRFSMPWSKPAARMREYVLALRAIWAAWQDGSRLDFKGDFYTHTLMTPFFVPEHNPFGPPPVYLAGVGQLMTEVAGEVADGFFVHPFSTARYLREVTLPALARGAAVAGRDPSSIVVSAPAFTTTGRDEAELAAATKATKHQIAFYASTPAYAGVLAVHGWEELGAQANAFMRAGRFDDLHELVDDEVLRTFSVVGDPTSCGHQLRQRYAGTVERISCYTTYESDPSLWPAVLEAAREV